MQLVMFDIDGTLTETMKVDEECFVRSFAEVFGFTDIDERSRPSNPTQQHHSSTGAWCHRQ
jgi:beta-phosphoglucomutase-like phosphatase (HAD superfamily)